MHHESEVACMQFCHELQQVPWDVILLLMLLMQLAQGTTIDMGQCRVATADPACWHPCLHDVPFQPVTPLYAAT